VEPAPVETFWPPPPEALRAWRRRTGTILAGCALLLIAPLALLDLVEDVLAGGKFDLVAHLHDLAPLASFAAVTALVMFLVPIPASLAIRSNLERATLAARVVLEPGEVLQAVCPGMIRGRGGFLVVTDQRFLFLRLELTGFAWAGLTPRAGVVGLTITQRRWSHIRLLNRVGSTLFGVPRGLAIHAAAGEWVFHASLPVFEALRVWLTAQGLELAFRNEDDLAKVGRRAPLELKAVWRRSDLLRNLRLLLGGATVALAGVVALVILVFSVWA